SDPKNMLAVADLSKAYPTTSQVRRGVQLIGRQLLVQDEITSEQSVEIAWNLHTAARIEINGQTTELIRDKQRLRVHILQPADALFVSEPADIPPATRSTVPRAQDQARKPGSKLVIRQRSNNLRLVVLLSPADEQEVEPK